MEVRTAEIAGSAAVPAMERVVVSPVAASTSSTWLRHARTKVSAAAVRSPQFSGISTSVTSPDSRSASVPSASVDFARRPRMSPAASMSETSAIDSGSSTVRPAGSVAAGETSATALPRSGTSGLVGLVPQETSRREVAANAARAVTRPGFTFIEPISATHRRGP